MPLNPVRDALLQSLRAALPEKTFRTPEPHYFEEPRGTYQGQAGVIVAPSRVEEVSTIVRMAAEARVGIVPYGGGTGLVGGQIMQDGPTPILISLERMTKIRSVDPLDGVMIAEAGAILHDVHAAADAHDRLFPLWLASEGSCRIGGNLSTNAGGVNVIRYGNARDLCLGLEAVLPDGQIWHGLKRLRKDNTGYDLRNLLIGAEGTLGIITATSLRLFPKPDSTGAALMVVPDPDAALGLLELAQRRLGGTISAFELIHGTGLQFVAETMPQVRQPFAEPPEWSVLIDVGMSGRADPKDALTDLFADAAEAGLARDGLIAQSEAQRQEFWHVREVIPSANKAIGALASNDIALPVGAVPDFIRRGAEELSGYGDIRINSFGHLGDGNLHYNLFPAKGRSKADYGSLGAELKGVVQDLVAEFGGSFSAEHGIGRLNVATLERYGDPVKLSAMRAIKTALDPLGIMNPGAILR
ncbi:MAG: FAD-binding oxidoreductase [Marinosulfonomonas sp.]|nr:FAD-binding oxidoreductase [Marinosulfonomonas sp.]